MLYNVKYDTVTFMDIILCDQSAAARARVSDENVPYIPTYRNIMPGARM